MNLAISSQEAIQILARHYSPFIHLPPRALVELNRTIRLFELHPGEEIRISARSAEGDLYLIGGEVSIAAEAGMQPYSAGDDRRLPINLGPPPNRLTVIADSEAILCQCESQDLDQLT